MPNKKIRMAIAYDFDGTLSPGNMQEYEFVPNIGMKSEAFWNEVNELAKTSKADEVLTYMYLMLEKARNARVPVHQNNFKECGEAVDLFEGVTDWFDRITAYGEAHGVKIEHFVISSGIREMIMGTPISKKFKSVYASSFIYDHNGVAQWPALAINYTAKTQYLFRINKGVLNVYDNSRINEFVPKADRPVPFENLVFMGDGSTDIPCFSLVKSQGGHSIAVYRPKTPGAKQKAEKLIKEGRVNFIAPADYSVNSDIDTLVKAIIEKVTACCKLNNLGKKE